MNAEIIHAVQAKITTLPREAPVPPRHIGLLDTTREVELIWRNGTISRIPFPCLRYRCACAGCAARRRAGLGPHYDPIVDVVEIRPVSTVGLEFVFSDGHGQGVFTWRFLRELGETASAGMTATIA